MRKKNQHIVPLANGWAVKGEGSKRFTIITETKKDAVEVGREIAINNRSDLIVHGRNGRIQEKDSYGKDPLLPKDTKN